MYWFLHLHYFTLLKINLQNFTLTWNVSPKPSHSHTPHGLWALSIRSTKPAYNSTQSVSGQTGSPGKYEEGP
jgi:hypothetical protein